MTSEIIILFNDNKQIHESFLHANVGDIDPPGLVGPADSKVTQQVGVDILGMIPFT